MMKKISIVIPAYNAEKYIESAVSSAFVLSDTICSEIILVNDGSKDSTLEICHNLAKQYKNVVVINQHNAGAMAARAIGALSATGDYVMFCDADDSLETNNLASLVEIAYAGDYDIIVGCSHDYSDDGEINFIQYNKISGRMSAKAFIENILKSKIIFGPACKLFRRNLITPQCFNLPGDIVFNEDLFMNIAIAENAKNIFVIRDLVVYNHLTDNPDSVTHTKMQSEEQWLKLFKIIHEKVQYIPEFDNNSLATFICDRLRTNYFNQGKKFFYSNEILAMLCAVDKSRLSVREITTMKLLRYPILSKMYNRLFKLRKK